MEVLDLTQLMDDAPFKKNAKYVDLDSIPEGWVGEIIDGDLYAFPRPRTVHARSIGRVFKQIEDDDDDNPSGWIVLMEPEVRFGKNILVPDLAGWRRSRMPKMPNIVTVSLAPDWVCEGLSPSTARLDRGRKFEIYGKHRVGHVWYVNPDLRLVEVFELDGAGYRAVKTAAGDAKVSLPPFPQRIALSKLWKR